MRKVLLVIGLMFSLSVFSQEYNKLISEEFEYTEGMKINIQAEKANIKVVGSATKKIRIKADLVSKNEDSDIALKELEYIKYDAKIDGNELVVRNWFSSSSGYQKVKGQLFVELELQVPQDISVIINSKFGTISMENLKEGGDLDLRFITLDASNLLGNWEIKSTYGENVISNSEGSFEMDLTNNISSFNDSNGIIKGDMQFGQLTLNNVSFYGNINAYKTELLLENWTMDNCLSVEKKKSDVYINGNLQEEFISKSKDCENQNLFVFNIEYSPLRITTR